MRSVSLIPVDIGKTNLKKRVAIYARVSKRLDEQESSYDLQINELIKSVESNSDYQLVCVFADKESGMNVKNRPSFNQMMDLARVGGLDMIITKSVSRFGRNAIEIPGIIRELRGLGVSVYFEKENISTKDFADEFLLNILSGVAEEESRQTSSNIRWSIGKKMSKGGNTTTRLYGYKIINNEFLIVANEADVVRSIYDWYINQVSYAEMIKRLHSMNIKSPTGRDYWRSSTIENILTNEKYCGDSLLGRRREEIQTNRNAAYGGSIKYFIRNNHQGIISREMFEWVKTERNHRTKHHHRGEPQIVNPESDYFYSVELQKHFRYKVERPKGKYEIPVLLAISNGERRMYRYSKIVEGIESITKELSKKFNDLVTYYSSLKNTFLESLESEISFNTKILEDESDLENKLDVYERISNLQIKRFTYHNLDTSLKRLRTNINSLLDNYSIEKVKKVYSAIRIDGLTVSLVINLTSSKHEVGDDNMSFVDIKIPYILNYKPCELSFNIILE